MKSKYYYIHDANDDRFICAGITKEYTEELLRKGRSEYGTVYWDYDGEGRGDIIYIKGYAEHKEDEINLDQ